MSKSKPFLDSLGESTATDYVKDIIDSALKDNDAKPVLGGLMLGVSLVRLVPLPPPVTIGLCVAVGVYGVISKRIAENKKD